MKIKTIHKELTPELVKRVSDAIDKHQPFKHKVEEAKAFLNKHPLPKELFG